MTPLKAGMAVQTQYGLSANAGMAVQTQYGLSANADTVVQTQYGFFAKADVSGVAEPVDHRVGDELK
jgi:hypothetical protein